MKLIKIGAMWCPSCIIMNKVYQEITNSFNIELVNYDYDFDEEQIIKYNVGKTLPVAILIDQNNQEILRLVGELKKQEISEKLEKIIRK